MLPGEEQRSLSEHPLPIEGDDSVLPTRIAMIEKEISSVEAKIAELSGTRMDLYSSRAVLVDHAIAVNVMEDPRFKLEKVVHKCDRIADPIKLKERFSKTWLLYVAAIEEKAKRDAETLLQKAKDAIEVKVNLGLADKIFGKNNVNDCCEIPERIEWKVVKK